jgi:hypothetical protein
MFDFNKEEPNLNSSLLNKPDELDELKSEVERLSNRIIILESYFTTFSRADFGYLGLPAPGVIAIPPQSFIDKYAVKNKGE